MFNIKIIYIFALFVFLFVGCDLTTKPVESNSTTKKNTLNDSDLGHETGNIQDYFYNFDEEIDAQFLYYSVPYYSDMTNTIQLPNKIDINRDTLNFKTFPDYLIDITPDNIDLNATLYTLDEGFSKEWCELLLVNTECKNGLDFNEDGTISDGVHESFVRKDTTFTISWVNLEFMKWDSADGRYKVGLSEPNTMASTHAYTNTTDIYDSLIYIGIIDTLYNLPYTPISNLMFIDRGEWEIYDTTFFNNEITHTLQAKFNYTISVLGQDSLMFRINGDCDRDGEWDDDETYHDYGSDWCPDNQENGNGECFAALSGDIDPCNCLDTVNPDYVEGSDPNGDNWRDCGWDKVCSEDSGDTGADFNGTEGNGIWDQNEGLEGNGIYDFNLGKGEYFEDRINGVTDPDEFFFDSDSNGEFDSFKEPFEDKNCNGVRDVAESEDAGNGIWDDDELYVDSNSNGEWDPGEPLYSMSEKPITFLVDYPEGDLDQGVGIKTFLEDTTLNIFTFYDDNKIPQFESFSNLIITKDDSTTRTAIYADVDSTVTVYSNVKIESLSGNSNDYHVTKTKWYEPFGIYDNLETATTDTLRLYDYDYHIFKVADNGNILKITHPDFFNHYGYFNTLEALESGVWEQSQVYEEVYIYTKNNEIRAGEYYYHDTTIVTSLAEYRVEDEFEVEFCDGDGVDDEYCSVDSDGNPKEGEGDDEVVSIPIKQMRFNETETGNFLCIVDSVIVSDSDDCSADSMLTNVFKIIRTRTVTMIGNGVEMGTRNTIWLAEGLGIVKDKLEIRWSEPFWEKEDSGWKEYSRLELSALRSHDPGLFRNIFNPVKVLRLDQFENESTLENDPYRVSPTYGMHRIRNPYDN